MNAQRHTLIAALFAVLALGATGCTLSATPNLSVAATPTVHTTHVVHHSAPTRVYYGGRWLHYRSDGYYYRSGSTWHVARTVPSHVTTYHRPGRPVHVTSSRAPATRVYRPSGPTHVRRTTGPTHVRRTTTSRPTHVQRTTSNRRTYYRR